MTLANPLGLLALLAIPIVIAIHFLQRRAQILPVSTLFLLQKTQKESASGRKFDRLMNSIPLWLQLLIVILITWLLAQPRYVKSNSTQRIAIVLDSSASMSVFRDEVKDKLLSTLPELMGSAEQAEYWLLESNPSLPRLYRGNSLDELTAELEKWQPSDGATDPTHSLRIARSLAGSEGALLYLTDTPKETISYNAHVHSVGAAKSNCGFTGISYTSKGGQIIWQTLVRNYSTEAVTRTWYLENEKGQRTSEKSVTIRPRKIVSLQGAFPEGSKRAKIVLSSDDFQLDDVLPIIKPQPKSLSIFADENYKPFGTLASNIQAGFPNIQLASDPTKADIKLITSDQLANTKSNSISFNKTPAELQLYLKGIIVAEKHPLMDGLNWQSLLVRETANIPHTEADIVLLWQGTRPLIYLRPLTNKSQALVFNFDLEQSNFQKTEAAVVLMLRFFEKVRSAKLSSEQLNTETSQPLKLTTSSVTAEQPLIMKITALEKTKDNSEVVTTKSYQRSTNLYAPQTPCYFSISQNDKTLLTAANYFADTREADFSNCKEAYLPASSNASAVNRHTKEDHLWRYWIALALAAFLLSWHYASKKKAIA